jgi:chaperonin GroES
MNIKPLHDNVVIEPLKVEKTTKSGILLPDTIEKSSPAQGTVVAVGPGKISENGNIIPLSIKVGDKVMFKKYSPDEIEVDDQKYLILKEEDILAIL